MEFNSKELKQIELESQDSLEIKMKKVRKFIYDMFIKSSHAPVIEEIIHKFGYKRVEVENILHTLADRHLVVLQPFTNIILLAHPFSNIKTSWNVKTEKSKNYFGGCAWDAIAIHFSLHEEIEIESFCLYCNQSIRIQLKDKKFAKKEPRTTTIGISKPASQWWDNIIDTCNNHINYFCSESHLSLFNQDQKINGTSKHNEIFPEDAILKLSYFLYDKKIDFDYQRPTIDEERNIFQKLQLTNKFWEI